MDSTSTPPGPGPGGTIPPQGPPHGPPQGATAAPPDPQYGPPQGPPQGPTGFFDSMRRTGLVRPDESTRSGPGVCAAVANRLGVDATLVRVGVIVLTVFGGFGLLAYGLAWLLLPQADGRIHAEDVLRGRFTSGAVGSLVTIFFGFGGFGQWWWDSGSGWGPAIGLLSVAGVIALVAWAVGQSRRDADPVAGGPGPATSTAPTGAPTAAPTGGSAGGTAATVDLGKGGPPVGLTKPVPPPVGRPLAPPPPPAPPRPVTPPRPRRRPAGPAVTALVAGLALVAAAAVLLLDRISSLGGDTGLLATGAAVVVIGLAVLLVGLAGRRAGGLTALAVVALVMLAFGWADARAGGVLSDWRSGERASAFDDRTWAPTTVEDGDSWSVEFGSGTLDLTDVRTTGGDPPTVTADVRLGSMRVEVSDEQTIELDLQVREGSLEAPGYEDDGSQDIRTTIGPDGPVDLRIEGSVRLGELVVQEEDR